MRMHILAGAVFSYVIASLPFTLLGQTNTDEVRWSISGQQNSSAIDTIHRIKGKIEGKYTYQPGVDGDALRLDGYTTSMTVPSENLPSAGPNGFTVEAWVALDTYPWNWVPIFDHEMQHQAGLFFGIDAFGHIGLEASINGHWRSLTSTITLPLKGWKHIAGTYQTDHGHGFLAVFIDGQRVAQMPVEGSFSPAKADLLIGRVRQPMLPFPEAEVKPPYPIWYSLDGMLDELALYSRGRTEQEIAGDYAAFKAPQGEVLPWQKMPSGPAGAGRFGAYYASLKYEETWDRLREIGSDGDVVVRFDQSPSRLVFWHGLNYVPTWVSGNDKWYTDEFLEVWDAGCPDGGDCEPMSDKQGRFSHVEILESNEVRAVVHWRYALIEAVNYKGAWPDPRTGSTDWADEYWTVYPDGVAIRKQVLHSTHVSDVHEWQETIVLHQPGFRPEDDINPDAITLGNMDGSTRTYTWQTKPSGVFANPPGPADPATPHNANMQLVNVRSAWKPFQIVPENGVNSNFYNNEKSYFQFECWNHWPVAQIASSDRPCVTDDRPSHTSLSHLFWKPYAQTDDTATKILMSGLTNKTLTELIPLAKSWLSPPSLQVQEDSYHSEGYDQTQRAYVLAATTHASGLPLRMVLAASNESPAANPALLIRGWGNRKPPRLSIDGRQVAWGKRFRVALVSRLDSTDLLVWMDLKSTQPVQMEFRESSQASH